MHTPLSESLGKEKLILKASAATVGRPTGVNGKKMAPRRARVTSKELEKLTTKGLKAGGPGSGRKPGGGKTEKPVHEGTHKRLISRGWKFQKNVDDGAGGQFSRYTKTVEGVDEPENRVLHVDKNGSTG